MRADSPAIEHRWAGLRVGVAAVDPPRPTGAMSGVHTRRLGRVDRASDRVFEGLVRLLDASGVAVLLYDRRGRQVRATGAVERLLAEDAEVPAVLDLAGSLARECLECGRERLAAPPTDRRYAHTRHWGYRLVGSPLGSASGEASAPGAEPGGGAAVAVVIERGAREALTDDDLRARYGLSPREVEVARLVADGRSTPQAAAALEVSAHTARHHLERVFTKLGVTTRGALQALVRGAAHAPVGRPERAPAEGRVRKTVPG